MEVMSTARPPKSGIDYFPLDVHMDTRMRLIEAEFGLTGFAVVVKLLQYIYGQGGYYGEWNDEVALLFGRDIGLGGSAVSEIVSAAIRREIFDRDLYERFSILTSEKIQRDYMRVVARRARVEVENVYLLIKHTEIPVNVHINGVSVCRNPDKCIQKSTKESKGKESKVKESKGEREPAAQPPLSHAQFRPPTIGEVESYVRETGLAMDAQCFYDYYQASQWRTAGGRPITDWQAQARLWAARDRTRNAARKPKQGSDTVDKDYGWEGNPFR